MPSALSRLMDASYTRCVNVPRPRWIALPLGGLLSLSALTIAALGIAVEAEPRYRVVGQVACNGLPAAHAVVVFHPLDQTLLVHPQAITDAEGRFEVRTPLVGNGAPEGKYAVTVTWHPWAVEGEHYGPGRNVLTQQYSDQKRTPIRVTVASQTNHLSPWHLSESCQEE